MQTMPTGPCLQTLLRLQAMMGAVGILDAASVAGKNGLLLARLVLQTASLPLPQNLEMHHVELTMALPFDRLELVSRNPDR